MIGRFTLEQYARRAHAAAAEGDPSHFDKAITTLQTAAIRHDNANAWLEVAVLRTHNDGKNSILEALARARQCDESITTTALYEALALVCGDVPQQHITETALRAFTAGGVAALIAGEAVIESAPRIAARCAEAISPEDLPVSLTSRAWRLRARTAKSIGEGHAAWQIAIRHAHYIDRQRYLLQYTSELLSAGALTLAKQQFTTLQQLGDLPPALEVQAQVLLARIEYASGNPDKAWNLIQKTNYLHAERAVRDEGILLQADIAAYQDHPDLEAQLLLILVADHPHLFDRYIATLRNIEAYEDVLNALANAPTEIPERVMLLAQAEYAYASGDTHNASSIASELFEQYGCIGSAYVLAQIAVTLGSYEEALERYVHITHAAPDKPEALPACVEALYLNESVRVLSEREVRRLARYVLQIVEPFSEEAHIAERALAQLEMERTASSEYLVN